MSKYELDYEYQLVKQTWATCQSAFDDATEQWSGSDRESFEREHLTEVAVTVQAFLDHLDQVIQSASMIEECLDSH